MNPESAKNKALTMRRLITAVGDIFMQNGYEGLGVNKVARVAGVNKKLIYRYFGSLDRLIEAYVVENDYWMLLAENLGNFMADFTMQENELMISQVLVKQFEHFSKDKKMQELIRWELSGNSPLMKSIHHARESIGEKLLNTTDPHFQKRPVNFRAVAALLVGGIYYTILHAKTNGGKFADLDMNSPADRIQLAATIKQIVGWAYNEPEISNDLKK